MASLPNNIFQIASQRFLYNIDLIEKRYVNKRPSGLELDVNSGKIIQVVDSKRPRLTAKEAKEKMKKSFLAPASLFGNSSLCSPFVHDMTTSRPIKKRVLKHNRRFEQKNADGYDYTSVLFNNVNDNEDSEDDKDAETREERELFDLDDIFDDDADDEEEEEGGVEDELSESEEEEEKNENNQEFEDELDKEKEYEEEPFEIPEEEAEKEGISYKDVKITRALIERLTPKAARGKKVESTSFNPPSISETPKTSRKEKYTATASKKDIPQSTPVRASKNSAKASSAKSTTKTETPGVPKKTAAEEAASKKDDLLVEGKRTRKSTQNLIDFDYM
uniref:Uncharacterized protein n=1 Tax=Panagrolaimus sp. ES5 TaxID=591445 RepID=A0AC34GNV3_9BILA